MDRTEFTLPDLCGPELRWPVLAHRITIPDRPNQVCNRSFCFIGRISPGLIICATFLEPLGVRCFCAFAGLLKRHKIAEGGTEIVDVALHPQLWRPGMQRERELGCGPDKKNSSWPVASASDVHKATNCLPPEEVL